MKKMFIINLFSLFIVSASYGMVIQPAPVIIHDTSSGQPQVIQTDYQKVYLQSLLGQGKLDADASPASLRDEEWLESVARKYFKRTG